MFADCCTQVIDVYSISMISGNDNTGDDNGNENGNRNTGNDNGNDNGETSDSYLSSAIFKYHLLH